MGNGNKYCALWRVKTVLVVCDNVFSADTRQIQSITTLSGANTNILPSPPLLLLPAHTSIKLGITASTLISSYLHISLQLKFIPTQRSQLTGDIKNIWYTHPHKKGPVMKNYTRHLTSFSMVIYQAEHDLWCPTNVGWENFAQLPIFQVK